MIQKKVCMVGVFGTGKTSLVQQFVHTRFSEKYHSTVGVKIDRKVVELKGGEVTIVLWDLAGRDKDEDIGASYVRGAHGVIYVADGTRKETCEQVADLQRVATAAAGAVPAVIALNKCDLVADWALSSADEAALAARGTLFRTSAKSGEGVEAMFLAMATALIASPEGA
ncbi:MAG: GTP-binding protein [Gemmatimonadetes bacterium]|nr:GTP-binding protein [Gemmatimonadota bacterium]